MSAPRNKDTRLAHAGRGGRWQMVNPPVSRVSTVLHPTLAAFEASLSEDRFQGLSYGLHGSHTSFALEEARQAYLKHRKKKYFEHVRSYVTVNVALFLINMITGAEDPWFLFVLGGWGIGLFFDTVDYIWPKERDIEKGMRKFVQYRERERQKTERVLARASTGRAGGSLTISGNRRGGKIIIEKGDKRIEIG